jgi:hypothetical protein
VHSSSETSSHFPLQRDAVPDAVPDSLPSSMPGSMPTAVLTAVPDAGPTAVLAPARDAGAILGAEITAMVARERAAAERRAAQAAARATRAAARAAARAVPPERSDQFAHLTLDGIRAYRSLVVREDERVGYWQRVVTTRLVALRGEGHDVDADHLRPALEAQQLPAGRELVIAAAHAILPELPTLDALWAPTGDDLVGRIAETAAALTAYREALAQQVRAATQELIARYRQAPDACLSALPA